MGNRYVISEQNWDMVLYLINNFYNPVEIKGNSVKFKRSKSIYGLFDITPEVCSKNVMDEYEILIVNDEFLHRNRNNAEFRQKVERFVRSKYKMDRALNAERNIGENYKDYFEDAKNRLITHQSSKINTINSFLDVLFDNLNPIDRSKINSLKIKNLYFCVENNIISRDFAIDELNKINLHNNQFTR